MENLIKQMRVRFSGLDQASQGDSNIGDRRLPPKKTQSFKGEKKKAQNWFRRQFSGQMNQDHDSGNGGEYTIAVAAAAFAISSLEEAGQPDPGRVSKRFPTQEIKIDKEPTDQPDPGRVSKRFPTKEEKQSPGEGSLKKPEGTDWRMPRSITKEKMPEKANEVIPSMKKTQTFGDQLLNDSGSTKPEKTVDTKSRPSALPTKQPTLPTTGGTAADAWEKAKMDKINIRYEKLNSKISSWENEKKAKAKRHLNRKESELEKRRARALKNHTIKISLIDQVAKGARDEAEKSRKKDELKVREKAKKFRSTGKVPATCFCF